MVASLIQALGRIRAGRGGLAALFGRRLILSAALFAAVALSCGDSSTDEEAPTPTEAPSNTVWLCRPGLADNPCEGDLTATVFLADGTTTTETAVPAKDPPIDCFYVYPTVSRQETVNADLTIDPDQRIVAVQQASRFSEVCRVYAPMYRQLTLKAIGSPGTATAEARNLAYGDVLSAWQDYLAHYNEGRGVVFIGHSQGTMMLRRLIAEEVDPDPEMRRLLVSALLIGGNVTVAAGQDVGGDFHNIPACRSETQTGCVVAYSAFSETPPANTIFGRPRSGPSASDPDGRDLEVLCVNPASPGGGTGELKPYYSTVRLMGVFAELMGEPPSAPTEWLTYPGLYTARCESNGEANWLQVDTTGIPGDERPVVGQVLGPTWGLHLVDVNIALGNLVDLVRKQSAAFTD